MDAVDAFDYDCGHQDFGGNWANKYLTNKKERMRDFATRADEVAARMAHRKPVAEMKTAHSRYTSVAVPVFFDSTALPVLTGDVSILINFLDVIKNFITQCELPVSGIEIGGFVDPEEDMQRLVVSILGPFTPEQESAHFEDLGSFVEKWMGKLEEQEKLAFLNGVTFELRREIYAATI